MTYLSWTMKQQQTSCATSGPGGPGKPSGPFSPDLPLGKAEINDEIILQQREHKML